MLGFQAELLSAMIGGQYKINATLANFDAYVVSDKPSYFPGSKFSGKIILGKRSKDLKPRSVNIDGKELSMSSKLNFFNAQGLSQLLTSSEEKLPSRLVASTIGDWGEGL